MLKPLVKLGFCELIMSDRETLKNRKKKMLFLYQTEKLHKNSIFYGQAELLVLKIFSV